jgi:hypothetical protein
LVIDASSGQIYGLPAAPFSGDILITVHDSAVPQNSASLTLPLKITGGLTITTTYLLPGSVGAVYSAPLAAAGGMPPYSWTATGLPLPLTLNASTGQISGTPATAFTYRVTIAVKDNATPPHVAFATLALTINPN